MTVCARACACGHFVVCCALQDYLAILAPIVMPDNEAEADDLVCTLGVFTSHRPVSHTSSFVELFPAAERVATACGESEGVVQAHAAQP